MRAVLSDGEGEVVRAEVAVLDFSPMLDLVIPADRLRVWALGDPHLYDVRLELVNAAGTVVDVVESYAGLRSVTLDGRVVRLNGEAVFQRLVLDQGYYADGILTAPTDEALRRDIELSMAAGFNGARLHEKVFEERFLYHADRLGYLCWGEFADWGCDVLSEAGIVDPAAKPVGADFVAQWLEALERDFNHPCIVGWCGLNETWHELGDAVRPIDDVMRAMFLAAKAMDPTRPVLDVSGHSHRVTETDIFDAHDYNQDPAELEKAHGGVVEGRPFEAEINGKRGHSIGYRGQPYFVSEFGGIKWAPDEVRDSQEESWGYGEAPRTLEEFYSRFEGLCGALLRNEGIFGYCYTQLTDVFQEQNGILNFDRTEKFGLERLREAQGVRAAIEAE